MKHGKFLQNGRQRRVEFFEIFEREYLGGNLPKHRPNPVFLVKKVRAESRDVRNLIPEIDVARFLKKFDLVLRGNFVEHRLERVVLQGREIDALQLATDAQNGRIAGRKVQIRGVLLKHQVEESVDFSHTTGQ